MDWLVDQWPYIAGAALALLSAINAWATQHPDEARGGVRLLLLLALDVVSALQSRGSATALRGPIGRVKLPGQLSPRTPELRRRVADATRR